MRRYWIWILPLSVAATIVWLSHQTHYPLGVTLPPPFDKVAHFLAFAPLGGFLELALRRTHPDIPIKQRLLVLFVGVTLFAASDELHQYFVPGRSCDVFDWMADTVGGGMGLALAALPALRKRKQG